MYNDHEFDPTTAEEQARREQDEEFARRVRREVRRIERGEADEDIRADMEEEEQLRTAEELAAEKVRRRKRRLWWRMASGNILVGEEISKYYAYMLTVAAMFFISIVVLFWALHLDMKYTRIEREVQILRERSVRLQELRYRTTTHSAIVEQLRQRGIELYDPQAPSGIIEN